MLAVILRQAGGTPELHHRRRHGGNGLRGGVGAGRRVAGRRGRRERRHLSRAGRRSGRGHQRRARPPGLLRRQRPPSGRRSFDLPRPPPAPGWCAPTTRAPWRWPPLAAARAGGRRDRRHGRGHDLRHRVRMPRSSASRTWRSGRPARPSRCERPVRRVANVSSSRVPGLHNVRNATAALDHGRRPWGCRGPTGPRPCGSYRGVARRFERRGERDGSPSSTTTAIFPGKWPPCWRLSPGDGIGWWRCSSPTATPAPRPCGRTSPTPSFRRGRRCVVTDIYPAGEPTRPGVTGRLIADAVAGAHPDVGAPLRARPSTTPRPCWSGSSAPAICASPWAPAI